MKLHRRIIKVLLALLIISSCTNDDDEVVGKKGAVEEPNTIIVTVLLDNQPIGEGVRVITFPSTEELTTDANGQVQFENLSPGSYEVYAYRNVGGSGKGLVELKNDVQQIEIGFDESILIEPTIDIVSRFDQCFSEGEEIEFIATFNDNYSDPEELSFLLESHLDGNLESVASITDGTVSLITSSLSKARHLIRLTLTNKLDISSYDLIPVSTFAPGILEISLTQDSQFRNTIVWDNQDDEVTSLELYRSVTKSQSYALLSSLAPDETSFVDSSVPFSDSVFYFVRASNDAGCSGSSNIVGTRGAPSFEFEIDQAEMLPGGSIIYLRSGNKIIGIDHETLSIEQEKTFSGEIGYFHVGNNGFGDELYVPNRLETLDIYDLVTFEQKESVNVNAGLQCVVSDNAGLLYTSVIGYSTFKYPLRVVNRESLAVVDSGGARGFTRLRMLPSGNEIIEITTAGSPTQMNYFEFDASGKFLTRVDDFYHGRYPMDSDPFRVAPKNDYLVTDWDGGVYTANSSMTYVGSLPKGSDLFSDFEFNTEATIIYAGVLTQKAIFIYDYPSLTKTGEIVTKGHPLYLFNKGEELIVISLIGLDNAERFLIEKHTLNNQ